MDRRSFFRSAIKKGSETAVKAADARVKKQASRWIRPPFAISELEFLLACTRCSQCIDACPHDVIFSLSSKTGAKVVGTPALDLVNKGCHLCEDWPCLSVCEPKALVLPETDVEADLPQPKLARVTIDEQVCLPFSGPECGACFDSCPIPNALTNNSNKPLINNNLCVGCGLCREACITEPKSIKIASLYS